MPLGPSIKSEEIPPGYYWNEYLGKSLPLPLPRYDSGRMTKVNEESLLNYLKFKAGVEGFQTLTKAADRWIPNAERDRDRQLKHLTIIEKKRSLGLPVSDDEYEAAVNREKPFVNPGTGITMATSIIRNPTSPLLNLGSVAGLFSRGRHVSRISRYLGL